MNEDDVTQALKSVEDPEAGMNIVDLGLVYGISVELVGEPPWTPERMSPEAQGRFGWS